MATLFLVSTPIGNLSDVSPRAAETLRGVRRILAEDTRRTRVLADRVGATAPMVSLHKFNEASRTERVLGWLEGGEDLAMVSDAGTPLVADPGWRVVDAVLDAGHRVVPIPGPSAVLAALVASGLPTEAFCFLGFPERKGPPRRALLARVCDSAETVVLFESARRLRRLLGDLADACGAERRVAVARELTKVHESTFRGTLAEARAYYEEHPPRGEVTLVVAAAESPQQDPESLEEQARTLASELRSTGLSSASIAREIARRLDLPRNASYRIAHETPEASTHE